MQRRAKCVSEELLHVCEKEGRKFSQKYLHEIYKSRFLRSPSHNNPFSIIADPTFNEANRVLDAFVKDLRKTGKIAGVVHKKKISKEQMKKLLDSGELGPADSLNPTQLQRTLGCTSASFLDEGDEKINDS